MICLDSSSMRTTEPACVPATKTAPSPMASAPGPPGTRRSASTDPCTGSTSSTLLALDSATQTPSAPARTADGVEDSSTSGRDPPDEALTLDRAAVRSGVPEPPAASAELSRVVVAQVPDGESPADHQSDDGECQPSTQPGPAVARAGTIRVSEDRLPSAGRQVRVLAEDATLELEQARPGLHTELGCEGPSCRGDRLQGPRLLAGAVRRESERRDQPLPEGMLAHKSLQVGDELGAESTGEVGVHPLLQRVHPTPLKLVRYGSRERGTLDVGKRCTVPEIEGLGQHRRRVRGITRAQQPPPSGDQVVEPADVHGIPFEVDPVTRRSALDAGTAAGGERLAQGRDLGIESMLDAGWRVRAPKPVDEAIAGDHGVVERQHRQERPLLGTAQMDRPPVQSQLDGPQELDHLHLSTVVP